MKFHFVRHAETIWHVSDRYAGHTDIDLTENGGKQTHKLQEWAQKQNIEMIYTSGLKRAIESAGPTCQSLHIQSKIDTGFNEVNFGVIEGLTKNEFASMYPELWEKFKIYPATTKFPSGESGLEALSRALKSIKNILARDCCKEILVISHGTLIRLIITFLLDQDTNKYRDILPTLDNISVTTVELESIEEQKTSKQKFKLWAYNSKLN
jgi:probable phosphoglycerate mutase